MALALRAAEAVQIGSPADLSLPTGEGANENAAQRTAFGFALLKRGAYLAWPTIQVTAALTCSSVSAGLPPFGGMKLPSGPW